MSQIRNEPARFPGISALVEDHKIPLLMPSGIRRFSSFPLPKIRHSPLVTWNDILCHLKAEIIPFFHPALLAGGFLVTQVCAAPPTHGRARGRKSTAAKKTTAKAKLPSSAAPGSLERTRRLLLAALRVWELKQRPRDL